MKRAIKRTVGLKANTKSEPVTRTVAKPDTAAVQSSSRFTHDVDVSSYSGPSTALNTGKSRTPLRVSEFGSAPDLVMGDRDLSLLMPLFQQHGNKKDFRRGNADTGILNRAIRKGVLQMVSGEAASESAMLRFVTSPRASA